MNDQQLYSFITAVECGSFTKAEDKLFLSKQALKKQIDSLEDELGFPLVNRGRQGITPTPAGEEFLHGVKDILADMDALIARSKGIAFSEETIRIENPYQPRLLLEKAFDEFRQRFPNIKLKIILQNNNHHVDDILNDRADIAEVIYRSRYEVPGISCTKLFHTSYKCLMASSHPLASRESLNINDLVGYQVYVLKANSELISELRSNPNKIDFKMVNATHIEEISNICFNYGIYISKAYYLSFMQPLVTVPLNTMQTPIASIIYRENPSGVVREFIKVVNEIYSEDQKG